MLFMNFFYIVGDLFKVTDYMYSYRLDLGYLPGIVWLSLLHEAMRRGGVEESGRMYFCVLEFPPLKLHVCSHNYPHSVAC